MQLLDAYANTVFIPGGTEWPGRWDRAALAFRAAGVRAQLDLPYGDHVRERLDLFHPDGAPRGLLVFVHGGYWMASGRDSYSHLATAALAAGWAVAMPSYPLVPEVRLARITRAVAAAIGHAAGLVAGPIHLTGHSAGGHLVARMACADAPLPPAVAARIARVVPISPLAELEPLTLTDMAPTLGLDAAEIAAESPARLQRRPGCAVTVWVGGQERPSFLWQARLLSEVWGCPWQIDMAAHHFTVLDGLAQPGSALARAVLA